jgi:hypothetical protein
MHINIVKSEQQPPTNANQTTLLQCPLAEIMPVVWLSEHVRHAGRKPALLAMCNNGVSASQFQQDGVDGRHDGSREAIAKVPFSVLAAYMQVAWLAVFTAAGL